MDEIALLMPDAIARAMVFAIEQPTMLTSANRRPAHRPGLSTFAAGSFVV